MNITYYTFCSVALRLFTQVNNNSYGAPQDVCGVTTASYKASSTELLVFVVVPELGLGGVHSAS